MLVFYKRIHYQQSIGFLFQQLSRQIVEDNIVQHHLLIFWDLIEKLSEVTGIDIIEVFRQIIRDDDVPEIFLKLLQIGNAEKLVA
jgi:hypothetical protein